jgi:hypothetical protein
LDEQSIHGSNVYSKLSLDKTPTLFLEFHGSTKHVEQQTEIVRKYPNKIINYILDYRKYIDNFLYNQRRFVKIILAKSLNLQQTLKREINYGRQDIIYGTWLFLFHKFKYLN